MARVLIALDETEQSLQAAQVARRLFGDAAEYVAVNVADPPAGGTQPEMAWGTVYPWYGTIDPGQAPTGEDLDRARAAAETTASHVAARAHVGTAAVVGEVGADAVTAILGAAEEQDADVIVVGSHDKGWWRRLTDGSVSESLVRATRAPVLVVGGGPD